jgi:hypothetical protein
MQSPALLSCDGIRRLMSCVYEVNAAAVVLFFLFLCLFSGTEYFVGARLAELMGRETFNLYASFKRRNIRIWQTDEQFVKLMIEKGIVCAGTTSITLVRVHDVSECIEELMEKDEQRKRRRKGNGKSEKLICLMRAGEEILT